MAVDADGRLLIGGFGGIADTSGVEASTTAPALNASLAALPAGVVGGTYRLNGLIVLTATAETALRNASLRMNGVEIMRLPTLTGIVVPFTVERVTLAGNGIIDVIAVAAGVAGSIYNVLLTATRVE